MNNINNQRGFSLIELILILLVLGLVSFSGWWVYVNQHKSVYAKNNVTTYTKKATPTTIAKQSNVTQTSTCPSLTNIAQIPTGWQTYTSNKYGYSISYPSTWIFTKSGGSVDNLPVLDGGLFYPPGSDGPQYVMYVTRQTLSNAITNWQNGVKTQNYNGGLSGGPVVTILSDTPCTYEGNPAAEIITKQDSAGISYDVEVDISANNYLYDFSTGYGASLNTLSNSTNPMTGDVLSVVESLKIQ